MLTLYDFLESGNGYKARLLMALLDRPYRLVLKDILAGETRTADFLKINPNGRIPVLALEDGRILPESDAILYYLAEGTVYWPDDRFERAQVLSWMFFEQYSHEPYVAVARFWRNFITMTPLQEQQLPGIMEKGHAALRVMEDHLAEHNWFVGDRCTIADIALYAYSHMAPMGGFDLDRYPALTRWLGRVRSLPGYVTIDAPRTQQETTK